MITCRGCGRELKPRQVEVLGENYSLQYCDDCLDKAREDYKKLSEQLKLKVNPPKKRD
jgi:hypothetical protein